ncbi:MULTISPECIES: response regulator transcription factor [Methylomonas]|uniref:LuxR family transcriptional regulator n=2 Tax=Methylomonas TaxID=416 RepID=A0A126T7B4_9GAMM|nr:MULTISPECIES: response regulator transcription factor [Methylomonas]AMK77983.1 LuxR family transcriptional regulator [Methylomonas denitrificans]OAI07714.1 DNA-binding response regulator [Methylomonas methanica]TCV85519.1 LuxR family two component transcriptional regulator [Methylomonas methanica]
MNSQPTIDILLVDDHAIVREGYRSLIGKQTDLQVIAEAGNGADAYRLYKECQPDVVVTDLTMPDLSGLELIGRIKQRDSKARILVFSMHQNPSFARQACRAGALGYVSKSSAPDILLQAIRDVYVGRHILSADIAQALALEKLGTETLALNSLTVREFEILRLLVEANTPDTIAKTLNISPKTVGNCHYLIKSKLGVSSDIELTRLAIKLNVVSLLDLADPA